jgi:cell fate (sporulation/competence/biofilm development) regulator YlbF (YheA/YmcA/DUF963 family)
VSLVTLAQQLARVIVELEAAEAVRHARHCIDVGEAVASAQL